MTHFFLLFFVRVCLCIQFLKRLQLVVCIQLKTTIAPYVLPTHTNYVLVIIGDVRYYRC
jgi:hypothetical protein